MNIPAYETGRNGRAAHRSLKQCVAVMDAARHTAVLWFGEIMRRRLYEDFGYSSIYQYASEELGFSTSRTGDFKRLAERLVALPKVTAKVASGELGYTKAREIVKVAAPETEDAWLDVAASQSRRELESTVKRARLKRPSNQSELLPPSDPAPPPVTTRVAFEMAPSQFARFEALMAKIGPRFDRTELLLEMMESFIESENAPRGASDPRTQIHVHECPTCRSATVETPRGPLELPPDEAEAAACDARVHVPGERNRSIIPPRIRRAVLARDRHRCRRKGCHHTRFLDIHHLVPRARGGTNHPSNLVTLCSACHRLAHRKGMDLTPLLDVVESPPDFDRKAAARPCSRAPANT